jgi:hypothetical protein
MALPFSRAAKSPFFAIVTATALTKSRELLFTASPHQCDHKALPEHPKQRAPLSARFAKKRGRRQVSEKGRLLHMPRMQVQVRYKFCGTVKQRQT